MLQREECAGFDSAACTLICDAASHNRNLAELRLADGLVGALEDEGCLDGVLGGESSIRRIHLTPRDPPSTLQHDVIRLLRTNVVLESFTAATPLWAFFEDDAELDGMLRSHNCTLRNVVQHYIVSFLMEGQQLRERSAQDRVDRLLARNARMREDQARSVAVLASAAGEQHCIVRRLLPDMVQRFNAFPTLIYRFLRPDVEALAAAALLVRGNDSARVVVVPE